MFSMNKVERLKARLSNMRKHGEHIAKNTLHAGETLVLGSAAAYAEGRLSDDKGEWGYKGVPYAYMGGAVLFLTGLFAGDRYGADFFAGASGLVGAHLFRSMYETGLQSKHGTSGRAQFGTRVPMGLESNMRAPMPQQQARQRQTFGTALDGLGAR